jgi:hypothetical protein
LIDCDAYCDELRNVCRFLYNFVYFGGSPGR